MNMVLKRNIFLVSAALVIMSCLSCSGGKGGKAAVYSEAIDSLRMEAMRSVRSGSPDSVVMYADRIEGLFSSMEGVPYGDSLEVSLKGHAFSGELYLFSDRYGFAKDALDKAMSAWKSMEESGQQAEDYYPVCVLYNGMGLYEIKENMNYESATEYFLEGIKMAREHSAGTDYAVMYYNLAMSCFVREDAGGLKYALELLEDGKRQGSEKMVFMGKYSAALMHYVAGNYSEAGKYVKDAAESRYSAIDPIGIYCLYANVLMKEGECVKAGDYYRKALRFKDNQQATRASYLCLSYGNYMLQMGKPDSARTIFEEGLRLATDKQDKVFTYRLHKGISDASCIMGDYRDAFVHLGDFMQESDSLFSIERERAVNALAMKYESAKHETIIQRKNSQLHILLVSSLSVTAILFIMFSMYRKKNRLYGAVARQYRESVVREQKSARTIENLRKEKKLLEEKLEPYLSSDGAVAEKDVKDAGTSAAGQESDRLDELFSKLEEMMSSDRLYRESNLTRNRVADLLGTNRTYLSQAINEKTGKNFNQYVNGYRIAEALRILSDPDNMESMKAIALGTGFGTPNTFFKIFREETGLTPSMYREKIIEHRNGNLSL